KRNTLALRAGRVSAVPLLKPQCLHLDHVGKDADGVEDGRGERVVDLDESDRVLPRAGAPEVESGDVDLGRAERVPQRADEARFVVIAYEQHIAPKLGFESDALDRDAARLVAGGQGPGA